VKRARNSDAVRSAIARIQRDAGRPRGQPHAGPARCGNRVLTVGEITAALETVFGTWTERAVA